MKKFYNLGARFLRVNQRIYCHIFYIVIVSSQTLDYICKCIRILVLFHTVVIFAGI